jgi:O-antigen/teichoic acid export membrane protein
MVPSVVAGNIVQPIARFILGLGVLLLGGEVVGLINSWTLSIGIAAVVAAIFFRRIMTAEERAARPKAQIGPIVRFALPQGGSSLLGIQALGLGVLIIGAFRSNEAAGLFGVALMLQGPGNVFLGGIVNIWAPVVADLHSRGEMKRLESLYQVVTRWVATFSFPVWTALALEPDMFVELFAGKEGVGAARLVAILALGNFFYTGTGPTGYVLSMTGRPGINFANSLVGVALYVAGGLWAVPRYGVVGMAVVDAIVTATINSARVVEAKIFVGVQPFGKPILKPIAACAAGGAVLLAWRLLPGDDLWLEVAGVVVAAVVYLATLKALGIDPEEQIVWNRIKKRAKLRKGRS